MSQANSKEQYRKVEHDFEEEAVLYVPDVPGWQPGESISAYAASRLRGANPGETPSTVSFYIGKPIPPARDGGPQTLDQAGVRPTYSRRKG